MPRRQRCTSTSRCPGCFASILSRLRIRPRSTKQRYPDTKWKSDGMRPSSRTIRSPVYAAPPSPHRSTVDRPRFKLLSDGMTPSSTDRFTHISLLDATPPISHRTTVHRPRHKSQSDGMTPSSTADRCTSRLSSVTTKSISVENI